MGIVMKHSAGIERNSEHIYVNLSSKADSANAATFPRGLIENIPYKLKPYKLMEVRSLRRSLKKLVRSLKFHSLGCPWQNQHIMEKLKEATGSSERNSMMISQKIQLLDQEENSRNL